MRKSVRWGRLKHRTGWRIVVTSGLHGDAKRLRLQCVMTLPGRAQHGTTTRSARRASNRYETRAASEHAAMGALIESTECSP